MKSGLPIDEILPELRGVLQRNRNAVVEAPPGAGKSTVVPIALLEEPWLRGGRIVMLEPRRLATRAVATRMAATLARPGLTAEAVDDLPAAVARADVVSCATMATQPVIQGAWLRPGVHLDLVGGYRPDMREADDEAVRRARVFIDAWFTAADHCGDICQPLAAGMLRKEAVTDTFQLARGERPGRRSEDEITLFKSGGGGHEDLGTAQHILERLGARQ